MRLRPLLIAWSWIFRYVHIALDTVVLYGVLVDRDVDERGDGERSSTFSSGVQGRPWAAKSRGPVGPMKASKPVADAPVV